MYANTRSSGIPRPGERQPQRRSTPGSAAVVKTVTVRRGSTLCCTTLPLRSTVLNDPRRPRRPITHITFTNGTPRASDSADAPSAHFRLASSHTHAHVARNARTLRTRSARRVRARGASRAVAHAVANSTVRHGTHGTAVERSRYRPARGPVMGPVRGSELRVSCVLKLGRSAVRTPP